LFATFFSKLAFLFGFVVFFSKMTRGRLFYALTHFIVPGLAIPTRVEKRTPFFPLTLAFLNFPSLPVFTFFVFRTPLVTQTLAFFTVKVRAKGTTFIWLALLIGLYWVDFNTST
jgi:hypothetical protein